MIILPRQARDKHRESTQKEVRFLQEHILQRAADLRTGLPPPPAALSLPPPASDAEQGQVKEEQAAALLIEPIDWLALGWRVDTWSTTDAWSVFLTST